MFKRLCNLALVVISALALAGPSLGAPLRLAIIAEDPALSPASDLLTAKLSASDQLALVERAQLEKVYREQALAANGRDYLKLGQILGADGLLILRVTTETEPQLLNVRLVAVHAGIALAQHDYPWPLDGLEQFAPAVAAQFAPMFPKLAAASRDAVPVSILNLRSATANGDSEAVERQLTLLLYNRLMNVRGSILYLKESVLTDRGALGHFQGSRAVRSG